LTTNKNNNNNNNTTQPVNKEISKGDKRSAYGNHKITKSEKRNSQLLNNLGNATPKIELISEPATDKSMTPQRRYSMGEGEDEEELLKIRNKNSTPKIEIQASPSTMASNINNTAVAKLIEKEKENLNQAIKKNSIYNSTSVVFPNTNSAPTVSVTSEKGIKPSNIVNISEKFQYPSPSPRENNSPRLTITSSNKDKENNSQAVSASNSESNHSSNLNISMNPNVNISSHPGSGNNSGNNSSNNLGPVNPQNSSKFSKIVNFALKASFFGKGKKKKGVDLKIEMNNNNSNQTTPNNTSTPDLHKGMEENESEASMGQSNSSSLNGIPVINVPQNKSRSGSDAVKPGKENPKEMNKSDSKNGTANSPTRRKSSKRLEKIFQFNL
jgi:hypothetical protein